MNGGGEGSPNSETSTLSGNPSATRGILIVQDPEAREKEAYGHASQILGTTLQGRFVVIESKKHMKSAAKQHSWKGVKTIDEADLRIENGVIIRWENMRSLSRNFDSKQQCSIMQLYAQHLSKNIGNRLLCEKDIESILVWNAYATNEAALGAFIAEVLSAPNAVAIAGQFSEIALTADLTDLTHDRELLSQAVVITCEMGLTAHQIRQQEPQALPNASEIITHITTYLMSVSNLSDNIIRLALLHYFGVVSEDSADKKLYNRIINRFGHSILTHLFTLLFNKRTEAVALQYLLRNVPLLFTADSNSQQIVHEVLKYYMLKKTDRFCIFLQLLGDTMANPDNSHKNAASSALAQHLGALFKVASDIKHVELIDSLSRVFATLSEHDYTQRVIDNILENREIPQALKVILSNNTTTKINFILPEHEEILFTKSAKINRRGRKPSIATNGSKCRLRQVTYLGAYELSKAS